MTDHLRSMDARLTALEQSLQDLSEEARALRAALRTVKSMPLAPTDPAQAAAPNPDQGQDTNRSRATAPSPRARPVRTGARQRNDLERLLGRYGMMIIAMVAAVAAVGTFLNWAIRWAIANGYFSFGPEARVATGVAFAIALGAWGARLRRTERSFGSSLLALALAILHLCAYSAGPSLHLVPTWVAFAIAAPVSWALALFAHGENDELLWCVGFGGAAIAPFVVNNGGGSPIVLAIYAAALLFWGCFAMSHREWRMATGVFCVASALFVVGIRTAVTESALSPALALVVPFTVGAAGVVPFAPESSKRGMLRWLALLGASTALTTPRLVGVSGVVMTATCIATTCFWLVMVDRRARVPQSSALIARPDPLLDWIDAAAIPFAIAYSASRWMPSAVGTSILFLGFAAAWVAFVRRREVGPLRDAASFAAGTCLLSSMWVHGNASLDALTAAHLVVVLVVLGLHVVRPSRSWLVSAGVGLAIATTLTMTTLASRQAYNFIPFATEPSLLALAVTLTLIVVARFWRPLRTATRRSLGDGPGWVHAASMRTFVRAIIAAPWVWAFVWVLTELAMAFDPSTSTLLLVVYFASSAVGCVGVGRARTMARLRQIGLALAFAAAAMAFIGARTYFDVAARIAAYLVTSAFLLGIAYWYRRPGSAAVPVVESA